MDASDFARTEAAQRILASARRLFGERNFSSVSTQDIADAAGVSKANVFHHFRSKADLYEAALRDSHKRFQQLLLELVSDERELPVLLNDFGERHLMQLLENDSAVSMLLRHVLNKGSESTGAQVESIIFQSFEQLVDAFTKLKQAGRLAAPTDPEIVAMSLIGSHLCFFLLRKVLAQGELATADPAVFNQRLVAQLITGMAPPIDGLSHQLKLET